MQDTTKNNTDQMNNSVEAPVVTLGKMLSEARERLGLTVMDVASQIKFAPKQIEALEADDFGRLPEATFLRGFVRSYAKVLHLDAETLLAALPQKKAAQAGLLAEAAGERFPDARSAQRQNNLVWLGASLLLIAVVVGFVIWNGNAPPAQTKAVQIESPVSLPDDVQIKPAEIVPESAVIEPVKPTSEPQVPAAKPVAPRLTEQNKAISSDAQTDASLPVTSLRLEFIGESWAEIKDRDGKILSSRNHLEGTELRLQGYAPFTILIGNAPSVRLYYRDKEVDLAPHTRSSTQVAALTLE